MFKKIFIISVLVFVIAGGFLFFKLYLSKENSNNGGGRSVIENESGFENEQGGNQEGQKDDKIQLIIEGDLRGAVLDNQQKITYFNQGNFLTADQDGKNRKTRSAYPFNKIQEVSYNKNKTKAIIKNDGEYSVYNVGEGENAPFKSNTDNLVWSSSGEKVFYKYYDQTANKRSLNISNPDGSSWEELGEIPFRHAEIKPGPKGDAVLFYSTPNASQRTEAYLIDVKEEQITKIENSYFGTDYKWSPDGRKLLFSYTKETGEMNLGVLYIRNMIVNKLTLPTFADKCTWSDNSSTAYCAQANFENNDIVLPDDWREGKIESQDTFWKIDIADGKKERLVNLEEINKKVDAINLFLDKEGEFLFFKDQVTGGLHKLNLTGE